MAQGFMVWWRNTALAVMLVSAAFMLWHCQPAPDHQTPDEAAQQAANNTLPLPATLEGTLLAGRNALGARDWPAAAVYFQAGLSLQPENGQLYEQALLSTINAGDWPQAVRMAANAPQNLSPGTAQIVALVRVLRAVEQGDYATAERALADYPPLGFGNYLRPYMLAWLQLAQNKSDSARSTLATIFARQKSLRPLTSLHMAMLADALGETDKGEKFYDVAISRQLSLRTVWLGLQFAWRQNDRELAEKWLNQLAKQQPQSPFATLVRTAWDADSWQPSAGKPNAKIGLSVALFDLASVLQQEGTTPAALLYVRMSQLLAGPDDVLPILVVADIVQQDGFGERARTLYASVPQQHPLFAMAQLRVADSWQDDEQMEKAADVLDRLREHPGLSRLVNQQLADLWRQDKQFTKALPYYDAVIADIGDKPQPADWISFFGRGIIHEELDDWEKAEPDLRQALELDPENAQVLNYLGYSWADQGENLYRAYDYLRQAHDLAPTDPYIADSVGWVLYRMGRYDEAVTYIEEAAAQLAQDPTVNDHLGDVYWRLGRKVEANFQWERAARQEQDKAKRKVIEQKLRDGLPQTEAPTHKTNDNHDNKIKTE